VIRGNLEGAPLQPPRVDQTETREARYAAPGVAGAAPLATRAESAGLAARARRGVFGWLKTAAITLAALYAIGWLVVTIGVASLNRSVGVAPDYRNFNQRLANIEPMRRFMVQRDPRITLEQANRAFNTLHPLGLNGNGFAHLPQSEGVGLPWRGAEVDPTLFGSNRPGRTGVPGVGVIEASARGFSRGERDYLRMIGTAPLWKEWDLVARAPALDLVGSRFRLPFREEAHIANLPLIRGAVQNDIASAAVARAAWHLAEGRRDSAEAVLRAIVSYGFQIADNANFALDEWTGGAIVRTGREGLLKFYALTNDPRAAEIDAQMRRAASVVPPQASYGRERDFNLRRESLIEAAQNTEMPRGTRVELLRSVALSSCGDGRALVFGMRPETRAIFERARQDFARYPGERAVIDLMQSSAEGRVAASFGRFASADEGGILTAMDLVGRLYFNPRLATCFLNGLTRGGLQ
jgi:hypothetical protein